MRIRFANLWPKTRDANTTRRGDMQSGERFMQKVFCHQFTFRPAYHSIRTLTTSHDSLFIYLTGLYTQRPAVADIGRTCITSIYKCDWGRGENVKCEVYVVHTHTRCKKVLRTRRMDLLRITNALFLFRLFY